MNLESYHKWRAGSAGQTPDSPILLVPYMWIGDFVRCHTVVKLLKQRFPSRPIDVLTTAMASPLLDYMPGVRKGIIVDLPRRRIALAQHRALARRLRREGYGQALVMPRTWKSALALYFAGIPRRTGFVGEGRIGLINDLRWGERRLPRMVERCAVLALPKGESWPAEWPLPELVASRSEVTDWRQRLGLVRDQHIEIALAPGAVGPSKRWPARSYADLGRRLIGEGHRVWIVGGPSEQALAAEIAATAPAEIRDLTGPDLRNAILALAAADVAVSNDSGLLHVAAALDTPTIGIFGPTSALHWAPLNPLAAVIETPNELPCRPCHQPVCRLGHHLCMRDIAVEQVMAAARAAIGAGRTARS
ncbi:MAG TPA: lipopolysaccharide heptosyltransferase II [Xanthobacteraceae bacterium]